jgi:RNA polymerase sigma-70 factor (ECF subfamily)
MSDRTTSSRDERARAFDALVRPHVRTLYAFALRFTGSRADAEDLVQDVLVKLYRHRDRLAAVEEPRSWMLRVLYREFLNFRRTTRRWLARRRRVADALPDVAEYVPDEAQPDAMLERERRAELLNAAIERLNFDHRVLIGLHLQDGYTLEELTHVLGVPVGTLKSRLHRARAELRGHLGGAEPFPGIRCD